MKERFLDMRDISDKELHEEIERREGILMGVRVIVTLVYIPFFYISVKMVNKEESSILFVIMLYVVVITWYIIFCILKKIKPLYTDNLEQELKQRKKEREKQKILSLIANGEFAKIEISQKIQKEIFWNLLECGAVEIVPTPEGNVKISISPSFEDTEILEIRNKQLLKFFSEI